MFYSRLYLLKKTFYLYLERKKKPEAQITNFWELQKNQLKKNIYIILNTPECKKSHLNSENYTLQNGADGGMAVFQSQSAPGQNHLYSITRKQIYDIIQHYYLNQRVV